MFSANKIEQLQLALKSINLYDGKIDGIIGPGTLAAIKKFEVLAHKKPGINKPEISIDDALETVKITKSIDGEGADIEDALVFTLKNEGGYSNHPMDKGGPTNKGITIKRLSEYLGREATVEELKSLSYETIKIIYKKYYWDVMNLNHVLDQSIATVMSTINCRI